MMTAAFLQGELERLFELESMMELSEEWLGVSPGEIGSTDAKGAFARALVGHCEQLGALPALAEAMRLSGRGPTSSTHVEPDTGPAEGSTVGGYQLMEYLGRGSVGRVFLGERRDDGGTRQVAVKLYDRGVARERGAVLRSLPFARALSQLKDKGLANVLEASTLDDGRLFVVSEYVRGRSLAQQLQRGGRLNFLELRSVARGWLSGLSALHARGLVHGHLTPNSAFIVAGENGDASEGVLGELLTFRVLEGADASVPRVHRFVGDTRTLAPEVARGEAPDARSDVYAMGALLYEALTGRPPFIADSAMEQVAMHLLTQPLPPSQVVEDGSLPPALDGVILHALQKRPEERFGTAKDFADALESLGGRSVFPPAPAEELSREDLDAAIARFEAAPDDVLTAEDLEALVAPTRTWEPVVDAYADKAGEVEDPALKKRLWFRVARILSHELRDREGQETAYERVLEIDPGDAQARDALEELYRRGQNYERLVAMLLDRLDSEGEPSARAGVLREVGDIYETHLYQPENALVAYAQALSEEADHERTEQIVMRLAAHEGGFEDVESILAGAAENSERPSNALAAHVALARVQRTGLNRLDIAHDTLVRALALDPAYEPALAALSDLYRSTDAHAQLVDLLLHRADAASNAARARELRVEAARLLLDKLGDSERAEKLLGVVFAADPSHEGVAEELENIYRARGELDQALSVLERTARSQKPGDRASTLMRIAELHEQSEGGDERAIESYRAALALDEQNEEAIDGLVRILSDREAYSEVVPLLEQKLKVTTQQSARVDILDTLGTIHEATGDNEAAISAYERVVDIAPAHVDANSALTRLYRASSRFEDLAHVLDQYAKVTDDQAHKVDLLMQTARVWMVDIGSPERALFVCERVLAIDPNNAEALSLTARMRSLAGDKASAVEAMQLLAENESDPLKKGELFVRVGELDEQREDLDSAIARYRRALDFDRNQPRALEALRRIYDRRGDLRGEAELIQRAADAAHDMGERVRTLVQLGNFQLDRLNDRALASSTFESAAQLDPYALETQVGLGRIAFARDDQRRAIDLLEPLFERVGELPGKAARDACVTLGDAYRAQGQTGKAERAYLRAKTISSHDRVVLERLSDIALENEAYADATQTLGELLDRHGAQLDDAERAEALLKLGLAHKALGELGKASVALAKASELRSAHEPTLQALCDVYEAQGNSTQLLTLLDERLAFTPDAERRHALLVKRGDLYATQFKDREAAARSYAAALEVDEGDRNVLAKLMSVYSEAEDWGRLCDVLVRLSGVVESPDLKAKYLTTAASIASSQLGYPERASELYERALSAAPAHASAFQGLVDCLSRAGDYARLVSAQRTYVERNAEELAPEKRADLWDRIGELCEKRLERLDEAVQAYEAAHQSMPDDRVRVERLADLYGRHPNRYGDRAVGLHEDLLTQNPYRVESYKALRKLYTQLKRPDEAWVVCQALRGLNMAEPDEETFFKRHRVRAPATAQECISDELWHEYLIHEDQDALLTSIFALVQPAAINENARALESFGLTPQQQINCMNDQSVMAQMLFYASGVSLVPLPPVYYREHDMGGITFVLTTQPGLGLGPAAFQRTPDQALAFIAARQLSYFRPGHMMRQLAPSGSALRGWLLAAIRVANPRFPVPDSLAATVEQHQASLAHTLQRPHEQALHSLIERLLREHPEVDTKRWGLGVDLTADRIGFALSNSLDASVAVVRASPTDASFANERERLKALYRYAVSTQYIGLRRAIGITLG